jgi:hypothetical protein
VIVSGEVPTTKSKLLAVGTAWGELHHKCVVAAALFRILLVHPVVPRGENDGYAPCTCNHVPGADFPENSGLSSNHRRSTRTYWRSCVEKSASSWAYDVVTTVGGLGVVAKNVVVSKRAVENVSPPTLRNDAGIPAAMPITYSASKSASPSWSLQ